MNVYDFDKTIYNGDSMIDFYVFCLKKHPKILKKFPNQVLGVILYFLKLINKISYKEYFMSFLNDLDDTEKLLDEFWNINRAKIKKWYIEQQNTDDVIISASPEFIISKICNILNINFFMATYVDIKTGKILGENCRGKEKVKRFYEKFPNGKIDKFYSDSYSDLPLASIAKESYLVKGNKIEDFKIN